MDDYTCVNQPIENCWEKKGSAKNYTPKHIYTKSRLTSKQKLHNCQILTKFLKLKHTSQILFTTSNTKIEDHSQKYSTIGIHI
jgi:hypothetical protein